MERSSRVCDPKGSAVAHGKHGTAVQLLGQLGSQPWDSAATDPVPPFSSDAEPVNILCLDGGGIRGRNQVVLVEELEAALGSPVADQFDLVAGTSIGGCGALFVARYGALVLLG